MLIWNKISIRDKISLIYYIEEIENNNKEIIIFDVDSLINKKVSTISKNEWSWKYPEIFTKLNIIRDSNKRIVFFLEYDRLSDQIIESIVKQIKFPMTIFISCNDDINRKPFKGIWNQFENIIDVDKEQTIYVGSGELNIKFAWDIGINILTPQEVFNGEISVKKLDYCPQNFLKGYTNDFFSFMRKSCNPELIILVGLPSSGKTRFCSDYLSSYFRVGKENGNYDVRKVRELLIDKRNVIVDNINNKKISRSQYIYVARVLKIQVRCLILDRDISLAKHLNYYRHHCSNGKIPKVENEEFEKYNKEYEVPTLNEGFKEIKKINPKIVLDEDTIESFCQYYY